MCGCRGYACETLSLGLLYAEFRDAIREGDGHRVFRGWKYLFLIFKTTKRTNYAIEAFELLVQYHIVLPPWLAHQLKWSRFVNTHGLPGLHMDHLNRLVKTAINGLGANKSKKSIIRVGKMIGTLSATVDLFDKENSVPSVSSAHSMMSISKDLGRL